jgi:hypothetical protein
MFVVANSVRSEVQSSMNARYMDERQPVATRAAAIRRSFARGI